jgi:two-component system phosphate regulon sensor histidine kinase PhoR
MPFVSSFLIYFLTLFLIERFILRKIKILYRTVSSVNKIPASKKLNEPNLFEKLRDQVVQYSTEKKTELEQLKANEQFRKEFLGNVSHELKTPLFSIQGYVDILLDGGIEDTEVNKRYLEKISSNSDRLIEIVEDLILISQVESNQLKLNITNFSIYELCLEVIESLEVLASKKRIKINIKDEKHIHFLVKGDKQKLYQVIHNLIENAIFYTPNGSKVDIRFFDLEYQILVEISDNGDGIEEIHRPRLFERFYRVDSDRNRKKGGSGLGLSIVKKILEAHGHSIKVDSEIGKGTTFSFTLSK